MCSHRKSRKSKNGKEFIGRKFSRSDKNYLNLSHHENFLTDCKQIKKHAIKFCKHQKSFYEHAKNQITWISFFAIKNSKQFENLSKDQKARI